MPIITLNVGGIIFDTTTGTLFKATYFDSILTRWNPNTTVIFIDRSPHIFKHVLGLLRDPQYPYPSKYYFELDFYGINYDKVDEIKLEENIIKLINEKYDKIIELLKPICLYEECNEKSGNSSKYCDNHQLKECYDCTMQTREIYCERHTRSSYY